MEGQTDIRTEFVTRVYHVSVDEECHVLKHVVFNGIAPRGLKEQTRVSL